MGTEKDKMRSMNRNRPPPIPPRPQHLIPVKSMAKYSSMPDILNGWKKDTNPDLLKVNNAKSTTISKKCIYITHEPSRFSSKSQMNGIDGSSSITIVNGHQNYGSEKSFYRNGLGVNYDNYECNVVSLGASPEKPVNGKTSKKFSCIPSRSNSRKKKNAVSSVNICSNSNVNGSYINGSNNCRNGKNNNRAEISQTSWYVEDVGNTMAQLSKCEITLNSDDTNCRYVEEVTPPVTASSVPSNSVLRKERYRRFHSPMSISSSALSGLPPLPKSLSDASLLCSDKKLFSYPVNLSPSSSNASSSSRSSGAHSKVAQQSPMKTTPTTTATTSVTQDEQKTTAAGVQSAGDTVPRDERKSTPPPPPPRKPTSLDMKLAILRKEMHDLRQMDLSLLSQLWSLNEAIHEFRQMQESLSPHTPSSHSSDEDDLEGYYSNVDSQGVVTSNQ